MESTTTSNGTPGAPAVAERSEGSSTAPTTITGDATLTPTSSTEPSAAAAPASTTAASTQKAASVVSPTTSDNPAAKQKCEQKKSSNGKNCKCKDKEKDKRAKKSDKIKKKNKKHYRHRRHHGKKRSSRRKYDSSDSDSDNSSDSESECDSDSDSDTDSDDDATSIPSTDSSASSDDSSDSDTDSSSSEDESARERRVRKLKKRYKKAKKNSSSRSRKDKKKAKSKKSKKHSKRKATRAASSSSSSSSSAESSDAEESGNDADHHNNNQTGENASDDESAEAERLRNVKEVANLVTQQLIAQGVGHSSCGGAPTGAPQNQMSGSLAQNHPHLAAVTVLPGLQTAQMIQAVPAAMPTTYVTQSLQPPVAAAGMTRGGPPGMPRQPPPPMQPPPPTSESEAPSRSRRSKKNKKRSKGKKSRRDTETDSEDGKDNESDNESVPENENGQKIAYKRVDEVWDSDIHNYKLQDTTNVTTDTQYDGYILQIRRSFDYDGEYTSTTVDVRSEPLKECLQEVMGDIKGVSLVDEIPRLEPNTLFLYLEDFRAHCKKLKKMKPKGKSRRSREKSRKSNKEKRKHLKVLVKYLDKDYAKIKKSLYPMLENGLITFDLLWALWKPNVLAYTTTYGSEEEARAFKVNVAEKHHNFQTGDYYYIEGKYFEFDGKKFGYGFIGETIQAFRGARKITSLGCYPLRYHKNPEALRADLIERGKKFFQLGGVHYKAFHGMAFYKKRRAIVKINVNGRVMVDPSIHRRINPNYPITFVQNRDDNIIGGVDLDESDSDDSCGGCGGGDDDGGEKVKWVTKVYKKKDGSHYVARISKEQAKEERSQENSKLDAVGDENDKEDEKKKKKGAEEEAEEEDAEELKLSDEDFLIASPVVLGFSFDEKLWLEFTVSGINEIQWNEQAFESLVIQDKQKAIVKALVESHKYHAAESIDDVIQGKGKGLVSVLHGPPGTGKTLTAEGISELLKCPLYMVSAGELGTDSRFLEAELQKILDICHAWGAILLLDEADVFLEARNMHEIHRNALVSIFLRQLEYFQGILFLTTNRVETFDDAFQSRIHVALRYDKLSAKAKRAIFKIFIERVQDLEEEGKKETFSEEDYLNLSRVDLNGRQIKNTVRTAQALAVNKSEALSMKHINDVLDVQKSFERDLKGGTGFEDAMRSYY